MGIFDLLGDLLGIQQRSASPQPIVTRISVVYSTAPQTFTGDAVYITLGGNAVKPTPTEVSTTLARPLRPTTTAEADETDTETQDSTDSVTPLSAAASTVTSDAPAMTLVGSFSHDSASITQITQSIETPTSSHASSINPNLNQATIAQSAASATASPVDSQHSGMSGGAVAGLIFGLLLGIGAIVGLVIFFYKRRQQQGDGVERLDDEKNVNSRPDALPSHPQPMMKTYNPNTSSLTFNSQRPSGAGAGNSGMSGFSAPSFGAGAAAGATAAGIGSAISRNANQQQPVSSWERPGAATFAASSPNSINDPANPFGNHAEELSSSPPSSGAGAATTVASAGAGVASSTGLSSPATANVHNSINAADFPLPASPAVGLPATPTTASGVPNSVSTPVVPAALLAGGAAAGVASAAVLAAGSSSSPAKTEEPKVHRVQMNFMPTLEDELAISTGQLVKVQHEYDDGWAMVSYMDGSRSGVVPRTCLSKNALKPRPPPGNGNGSPPRQNGRPSSPGMRNNGPRSMSPASGRMGPQYAQQPRPMSPGSGPAQPQYAQAPRPSSPYTASPLGGGRARAASNAAANAAPYVAYAPAAASNSTTTTRSKSPQRQNQIPQIDTVKANANANDTSFETQNQGNAASNQDAEAPEVVSSGAEQESQVQTTTRLMSPLATMPSRKAVASPAPSELAA